MDTSLASYLQQQLTPGSDHQIDLSLPDAAQREVRQQPIAEEHGDERGDACARPGLAVDGLGREQALEVPVVLHGDE